MSTRGADSHLQKNPIKEQQQFWSKEYEYLANVEPNRLHRHNASSLADYVECPRRWAFKNLGKWEPIPESGYERPPGKAELGGLFHAMAAQYVRAVYFGDEEFNADDIVKSYAEERYPDESQAGLRIMLWQSGIVDYVVNMMNNFREWEQRESFFQRYSPVGVELHIEVPLDAVASHLPNIGVLSGYIDVVCVNLITGEVVIVDYKTVSTHETSLHPADLQMSVYGTLLRVARPQFGMGVKEFELVAPNIGMHVTVKRLGGKRKASHPFVNTVEMRYSETGITAATDRIATVIDETYNGLDAHGYRPQPGKHCAWKCAYVDVCSMMDNSASDWQHVLLTNYRKRTTNTSSASAETQLELIGEEGND